MKRISTAAVARPRLTLALFAAAVLVLAAFGRDLESRLAPTMLVVKGTPSAHAADLYAEEFGDGITVPVLLEGPPASSTPSPPAGSSAPCSGCRSTTRCS